MEGETKHVDEKGLRDLLDRHYVGQRVEEICVERERDLLWIIFENGRSLAFALRDEGGVNLWTGERPAN